MSESEGKTEYELLWDEFWKECKIISEKAKAIRDAFKEVYEGMKIEFWRHK